MGPVARSVAEAGDEILDGAGVADDGVLVVLLGVPADVRERIVARRTDRLEVRAELVEQVRRRRRHVVVDQGVGRGPG